MEESGAFDVDILAKNVTDAFYVRHKSFGDLRTSFWCHPRTLIWLAQCVTNGEHRAVDLSKEFCVCQR